mmetsp:Transcript_10362/g.31235  ORF Transcript_10362/g.31235 Transcript_10362/m.31235 type:complete len:97 (-) Transcript_10362:4055-4345(-)
MNNIWGCGRGKLQRLYRIVPRRRIAKNIATNNVDNECIVHSRISILRDTRPQNLTRTISDRMDEVSEVQVAYHCCLMDTQRETYVWSLTVNLRKKK